MNRKHWGTIVSGVKTRWVTVVVWIVIVAVLSMVWPQINSRETDSNQLLPDDVMSVQASKIAKVQFSNDAGTPLLLVWYQKNGLSQTDYERIKKLYQSLSENPVTKQSFIPPLYKAPAQALATSVSEDGKALTTPVFFDKNASTKQLQKGLDELEKQLDKAFGSKVSGNALDKDGLHVRYSGPVGIQTDAVALFSNADITLLLATIALVLILLIILYRSPLLAIVPLITVVVAYGLISPLLGILADKGLIEVDSQSVSIMTVLLFGAGTDYCLFLISRYRDELRHEPDKYRALEKALSNTGGAIMMSSMTTVLGLLTLGLAYYASYDRFAVPFSMSILIMGIAALTILPSFLAILGRIAFFPFIPRTNEMMDKLEAKKGKKLKRPKDRSAFSKALGNVVTQRPWYVIIACTILLGGLASFVPKMNFTYGLLDSFPEDMPSREGFTIISDHYPPGEVAPLQVIVDTQDKNVSLQKDLQRLQYVDTVSKPVKGSQNDHFQSYDVTLSVDPYSPEAVAHIPDVQKTVEKSLQQAGIAKAADHVWLGGETATLYDTEQVTNRDQSLIVPVVLGIIGLLLLIYLRSIVAMIYLLVTVVLSYLSALGLGWILLHHGFDVPAIQGLIPLYSFVFLVALGEDYNIFMISNIWRKRKTMPLKQAVYEGVGETGSVISSAGLILAGTFAVLAVLPLQVLVHFGTVTAIGILLDTFIVRPLLVPSITVVLGRFAFWPGKLWKSKDEKVNVNE
ncbi:MMPL family transporter [Virgibacillus halophilus]|uniref:MMPL family transporter n=1 Tax=Tigheibacillus halophilus TaxID=361280 RepID=UPI00362A2B72